MVATDHLPFGGGALGVPQSSRRSAALAAAAPCSPGGRPRLGERGEDPRLRPAGFQGPRAFSEQGTPELLRTSDCDFVFEWETPLVCPDEVKADGCALTDEQLLYSFNLSSLSKSTFKVTAGGSGRPPGFLLVPTVREALGRPWPLEDRSPPTRAVPPASGRFVSQGSVRVK